MLTPTTSAIAKSIREKEGGVIESRWTFGAPVDAPLPIQAKDIRSTNHFDIRRTNHVTEARHIR